MWSKWSKIRQLDQFRSISRNTRFLMHSRRPSPTPHPESPRPDHRKHTTTQTLLSAFHHNPIPISPDDAATQSMSTKETTQVSAIHVLLVAQVPFPDDIELLETFMEKLLDSFLHKNMCPLRFVCQMLGCVPAKNTRFYKAGYAKALVQWVRHFVYRSTFQMLKYLTA